MADNEEHGSKGKDKRTGSGDSGNLALQCADLLGQALEALVARAQTEEPFSPDLIGGVEPTLAALSKVRETYIGNVRSEIERSNPAARASMDDQIRSTGAIDLLNAAIAVSQIPSESESLLVRDITLANGARRIPWLEIAKEVINMILDLLPIPGLVKKIIKEILRILDKIFGGMPHEDHSPATETVLN